MRYVLIALGLWFLLEMVFVAILVAVSAIEGHRARQEAAAPEPSYAGRSAETFDRLAAHSHT